MPKKHKRVLSTAITKRQAASMLAAGASERKVARHFGCTPGAVNQFKKRNWDLIEAEQEQLLYSVPTAVDIATDLIDQYHDPNTRAEMSLQLLSHAHQHIMEVLRTAGFYPTTRKRPSLVESFLARKRRKTQQRDIKNIPKEELHDELMKIIKG